MEANTILNKTLFFHGKLVEGRRFTIAAKFTEDDHILLGISVCSKTDQFIKHVGRKKAEGRLNSYGLKGCSIIPLFSEKYFSEYATEIGFPKNWYSGKELNVFIVFCHELEQLTFKELKTLFSL